MCVEKKKEIFIEIQIRSRSLLVLIVNGKKKDHKENLLLLIQIIFKCYKHKKPGFYCW